MVNEQVKIGHEMIKLTPVVGIAGMKFMGIMVSDWLIILALIYTVFQIIVISPKVFKQIKIWTKNANRTIERVFGKD